MTFCIASWNVNSIRVRLPQLLEWLAREKPDVLALQETKTTDDHFPKDEIEKAGYSVIYTGEKSYNGVALLSKIPLIDPILHLPPLPPDAPRRFVGGTWGKIRILNVYAPNGESVGSDKYVYKLKWFEHLVVYVRTQLEIYPKLIVLGDMNVAPEDRDVYDPKAFEGSVLVSVKEREALQQLLSLGLTDAFRLFEHDPRHQFSWWNYRGGALWKNQGLRLDLVLISQNLVNRCSSCEVDKTPRKLKQPSDHAPVITKLK